MKFSLGRFLKGLAGAVAGEAAAGRIGRGRKTGKAISTGLKVLAIADAAIGEENEVYECPKCGTTLVIK